MRDISTDDILQMRGKAAYAADGQKIGGIETIYFGEDTNKPEWLGLHSGLFGSRRVAVPASGLAFARDGIRVPYPKSQVTHAPAVDRDRISPTAEAALYQHYGLYPVAEPAAIQTEARGRPGRMGFAPSAERSVGPAAEDMRPARGRADDPRADDREALMLREERLRIGKREVTTAVRMRKYVDVAPVSQEVELRKETISIERVPINRPVAGSDFREQQVSVDVREEIPIVTKEVVATEEIRLHRETRIQRERVDDQVRKERIELEGPGEQQPRGRGR